MRAFFVCTLMIVFREVVDAFPYRCKIISEHPFRSTHITVYHPREERTELFPRRPFTHKCIHSISLRHKSILNSIPR